MKDGRSAAPSPPPFLHTELITRAVNQTLGTNYRLEEIEQMPELWLQKVMLLAEALNHGADS